MPRKANHDIHKSSHGQAFLSCGASVGTKTRAMLRGGLLFSAGGLVWDCPTETRETSDCQAREEKPPIGQNKATGSQRNSSPPTSPPVAYGERVATIWAMWPIVLIP